MTRLARIEALLAELKREVTEGAADGTLPPCACVFHAGDLACEFVIRRSPQWQRWRGDMTGELVVLRDH